MAELPPTPPPKPSAQPAPGARPPHQRRPLIIFTVVMALLLGGVLVAVSLRDGDDPTTTVAAEPGPSTTAPAAAERSTTDEPTTTAPATTTTEPAAAGPDEVTLAFAGDLLPHLPLDAQAATYGRDSGQPYDFTPMLGPMMPVISAQDVAICHMETPVAPDQAHVAGYPAFAAPQELVDAAKAIGYDGCSTASNHSLDQGRDGIAATLDRMDAQGLRHAGTARTAEEGATVTTYDADGAKVAHLSYAYDFNGYTIPGDAPFAVNQIDATRIRNDATAARRAGAQLVVVSLHWGTEYQHEPSQYQRDVAAQLLPYDDIDLVIGHHAHVVQPIEKVGDTFVVWGLGNQLANQPEIGRSDGLTVVVKAAKQPNGRYEVSGIDAVPTYIEAGTFRVLPIVRTLREDDPPPQLRQLLAESYDRTAEVLAMAPTEGVALAPRP